MKKESLYKILIIMLLLVFQHSLIAEPRVIKVAAADIYPKIFKDSDGHVKGLLVDLLTEIAKKENIRFEYVFGTWNDGLVRIRSGEVDLVPGAAYLTKRALYMDYCKYPTLTVWGELYTLQSSKINGISDIQNKKIGVMKGDVYSNNFRILTSKFAIKFKVVELGSYEDVFKEIAAKRVDAGIVDVTFGTAKQNDYDLRSTGVAFNPLDIYFATAKGKNQDLRILLDRYINEWKHQDDSVLSQAKQKWLHGSVGSVAVIPEWLINALMTLGIMVIVSLTFILLLNRQVKKTTNKIRKSEQQISSISNNFQNGMIYQLIIGQDGSRKFTYLSDSVKLLYGITPEEGMEDANLIYSRIHEEDAARLAQAEEDAVKTFSTFKTEARIKEPSGAIRWSYYVSTPKKLDDGSICFDGIEFVITERKQAEEALRESEATVRRRLDVILEPEGDIGTLNLADIIDQEALQAMMEEFYRLMHIGIGILDVNGKVLVGVGWQDICVKFHRIHPDTLKNCQESDITLVDGVPAGQFKAYHCKNNMWDIMTPIELGGKHLGNVCLGQFFYEDEVPDYELFRRQARQYGFDEKEYLAALDRVPRWSREKVDAAVAFYTKLAEMISSLSYSKIKLSRAISQKDMVLYQLRESEERYRSILNASPDDITIADLDGRIIMVSPVAVTMFGYEREEELLGRMVTDFIIEEDRDRALSNIASMLQGALLVPREYHGLRADGSTFEIEANSEFIRGADGQPNSIVLIVRDITERKQIENEIKTLNAELEQRVVDRTVELEAANKELEAFSYSVSHDLRTPLRAIDGFSLAIIEEYGPLLDAQGLGYLHRVRAATVRMADLIDDLLKLSRVSRNEMHHQEVSLSDLVNNIISNLQQAEPERQVRFTVEPDIIAHGDKHLLMVMLENLLGNAWKFTGKQPEAIIEFGVTRSDGEFVYYIRDNGAGFDMAYASKLFGAFQRMHSTDEFPGTGIGLATVKRIINRHGGRIWAEAEVDKGATFYFTLKSC